MKISFFTLLANGLLLAASAQAHQHIFAGATDTNGNSVVGQGDKLRLQNPPASNFIFHLEYRPPGRVYGGYYSISAHNDPLYLKQYPLDDFTFAALATDSENFIAEEGHAAFGSYLVMEITSVAGPAGGQFSFWESFATSPTYTFTIGQSAGGFRFNLSDPTGDGDPGNPFGHIHDRAWTIDAAHPGTYTVGFKLYDTSTAGTGGGPIHLPSDTYFFTFQTVPVPEPGSAVLLVCGGMVCAAWRRRR